MGLWAMLKGEEPGFFNTILHYKNPGQFGEYATEFALTHDNISGYSKTMCNLYLPYKNGTTELDVVMIHEKGIYIFESKNYSGWIFGDTDQLKWTQSLNKSEKNQFYNPIKQNQTHCKAMADFLNVPIENIVSYIVFSQRCELKRVPEDTAACKIVKRDQLLRKLRAELKGRSEIYTKEEVGQIANRLICQANASDQLKEKHVEEIKAKTEGTVCPFCGSELVLRSGKYGQFYGCTKYPKCRFTRKLEQSK